MEQLLTPDEVAARLRVTKFAVYRWVNERRLRPLRAGILLRFEPAEIDRFLREESSRRG